MSKCINVYKISLRNEASTDNWTVVATNIQQALFSFMNINPTIFLHMVTGIKLIATDVAVDVDQLINEGCQGEPK